ASAHGKFSIHPEPTRKSQSELDKQTHLLVRTLHPQVPNVPLSINQLPRLVVIPAAPNLGPRPQSLGQTLVLEAENRPDLVRRHLLEIAGPNVMHRFLAGEKPLEESHGGLWRVKHQGLLAYQERLAV